MLNLRPNSSICYGGKFVEYYILYENKYYMCVYVYVSIYTYTYTYLHMHRYTKENEITSMNVK